MSLETQSKYSSYIQEVTEVLEKVSPSDFEAVIETMLNTFQDGKNIFFIGNGGSASTASHLAADIGKNTVSPGEYPEPKRFRTLCLNDNQAWLTAVANDLGFEHVFTEQLKSLSSPGDLLFIISGSGNSPNVVQAAKWSQNSGIRVVALLGFNGGEVQSLVDSSLIVSSSDYGIVEGVHAILHHYIVDTLRENKKHYE